MGKLRHRAHKRAELPQHPFAGGEGGAGPLPSLLFPSTGSSVREQLCLFGLLHLSLQIRSLQQIKPGNIRKCLLVSPKQLFLSALWLPRLAG